MVCCYGGCHGDYVYLIAFMGEFHKMAAVINGLATTFAMEEEDCKSTTKDRVASSLAPRPPS